EKVVATLAAVRNGSLTRVGSIASVVATASRYAIQTVLIHRAHRVRQWVAKIFFASDAVEKYQRDTIMTSHDINRRAFSDGRARRMDRCVKTHFFTVDAHVCAVAVPYSSTFSTRETA